MSQPVLRLSPLVAYKWCKGSLNPSLAGSIADHIRTPEGQKSSPEASAGRDCRVTPSLNTDPVRPAGARLFQDIRTIRGIPRGERVGLGGFMTVKKYAIDLTALDLRESMLAWMTTIQSTT